jgi:hypothetical protein
MADSAVTDAPATADDLSVVSVVYGDKWCLDLHRRVAAELNGSREARWYAVRNLPPHPADAWTGDERYETIDGAELAREQAAEPQARSIHHALGLAVGARGIRTRYVLFVDADFFVLRTGWYSDVVGRMRDRGLAFFGAPYHPRTPAKLRYFPCAVAVCIDTEQVDAAALDWRPAVGAGRRRVADALWEPLLRRAGAGWRIGIEASVDTGIAVYERHRDRRSFRAECVVPVFTAADARSRLREPRELLLEALLPDRFCTIPRRRGYFTDRPFAALGLPDAQALGCEEYWWRDEPFAVHLRGAEPALRSDPRRVESLVYSLARLPR